MGKDAAERVMRRRFVVRGIVQGVGFRPFVYGLALRLKLTGFVRNDSGGVTIEVEGAVPRLDDFAVALRNGDAAARAHRRDRAARACAARGDYFCDRGEPGATRGARGSPRTA
ncbi:carbamoyltransferase HypF, partial [Candidatus Gracilibacteria bacterium]|nr:carbamoyltransferase HypF [Candidatus Gracilibacteria bacterium]